MYINLRVVTAAAVCLVLAALGYVFLTMEKDPEPLGKRLDHDETPTRKKHEPVTKPRTQLGKELKLLDPYSFPDDPSVNCVPLNSATNREKICTYPTSSDNYISKVLNKGAVWENNIINLMKDVLNRPENKDMGLIDIGTNLGVFSLTAASMGHPVVGAEPFPPNIVRLAKTMRLNSHLLPELRILPNATSDKYETMVFWAQDNNVHPGGTKTHNLDITKDAAHHQVAGMQVEAVRTDDLLHFVDFKRAILKADIEGGEYKALNSAFQLFDRIDITHVFMEWNKKYEVAIERHFFIEFFRTQGYTVHRAQAGWPTLELSEEASSHWPFDVVFIKT